jgi:zinc protease
LERFRAGIEKVTPADVDRVARKYIHPEKMAVLVVGNSKDFDRELATFGKVTNIDIKIPQKPGGSK